MKKSLTLGLAAAAIVATSFMTNSISAQSNRTAFYCDLGGGRQPHVMVSPFFNTIAFAQRSLRHKAVIVMNPNAMRNLATHRQTVIMSFLHECGHHVLNHTSRDPAKRARLPKDPKEMEKAADCYAVQHMMHRGLLTKEGLRHILADFRKFKGSHTHPNGQIRGQYIVQCIRAYQQHMYGRGRGGYSNR